MLRFELLLLSTQSVICFEPQTVGGLWFVFAGDSCHALGVH